MLIIEFSYNFLYVWNCMKLYDKKFLIYGNCMIRSFGQPGRLSQQIFAVSRLPRPKLGIPEFRDQKYLSNFCDRCQNGATRLSRCNPACSDFRIITGLLQSKLIRRDW